MDKKIPRILVIVLTTMERNGWATKHLLEWCSSLRFHERDEKGELKYLTSVGYAHNFTPAAAARNYVFNHVLQLDPDKRPDWVLMIDNDMVPPDNLMDTIKGAPEDAGVMVPRFYMWDDAKGKPILCWGMDTADAPYNGNGDQVFLVHPGKHYPLTKCGTGAIFFRSELIADLQALGHGSNKSPFFWYTYNDDGAMVGTEDINFCKKVHETKWKIYGVSSIEVGHYHNVDLAVLARWLYETEAKKQATIEEFPAPVECFR